MITPGCLILNGHTPPELRLDVIQQLELLVFVRNYRHRQRPLEAEARIVVHEAALIIGRVELADLVARLRVVAQRLITVCEAFWHVKRAAVLLVQLDGNILEVGRAFRAQIHDDVENRAACATHQLGLRRWGKLEMHSAQRALLKVVGDICLRDKWLESMGGEFFLAKGAREKTS